MELEKRKRESDHDDVITTKKKSTKPEDEEEVEEFFAILRRIHEAVKYFKKAEGSGRNLTATVKTWKPSFEVEDFKGVKDTDHQDLAEDNSGLDLNAEPAIQAQQDDVA